MIVFTRRTKTNFSKIINAYKFLCSIIFCVFLDALENFLISTNNYRFTFSPEEIGTKIYGYLLCVCI